MGLKSHPCLGSNLASAMASHLDRAFGGADVEIVGAEASYVGTLAAFVAYEAGVHAAAEVCTAHTSDPADVSEDCMDNCTVDHVGVAVKEFDLAAVSGKNRRFHHRLRTADADNVQSAGATQAVDERAAVDQKMHLIHFGDDAEDCAGVGDVHLFLYSTGV